MRKIISLLLAFLLCFSFVFANAKMPDELAKVLTEEKYNFTCSAQLKLSNAEFKSLVEFIKELAGEEYEEIEYFTDLELVLETLFTSGTKIDMQADISKDFRKMNIGISGEFDLNVKPNENLEVVSKGKAGMWIEMNMEEENPAYRIILQAPWLNKYAVIDLFAAMSDEDKAIFLEYTEQYEKAHSEDLIEKVNTAMLDIVEKHSDIKKSGNKYTIKFDNNGFVSMVRDVIGIILDVMVEISPEIFDEDPAVAKEMVNLIKQTIPSLSGMTFVGEKGVTVEYVLSSGNIKTYTEFDDIKIDIPSIVETLGMEWEFETRPVLEFEIKASCNYSLYGKTKVDFPVLTEENSFDMISAFMPETEDYVEEEYIPEYPLWSFSCTSETVIENEDKIYVPLRGVLEEAYGGNIDIAYNEGVITLTSAYFEEYDKIVLTVGSPEATVGEKAVTIEPVILVEGVSYISEETLKTLFNYSYSYIVYDLLEKTYYIDIWEYMI